MLVREDTHWSSFSHCRGSLYWISSVSGMEPQALDEQDLKHWASEQRGNWAAILVEGQLIHLITDVPRSFPLHYLRDGNEWLVSQDIRVLQEAVPNLELNLDVCEEFRHVGLVMGRDTLLRGVSTARAFSITTLHPDGRVSEHFHTLSFLPQERYSQIDSFLDDFVEEVRAAFANLLEVADGRQLVVPLSGGADSRLLLGILKELGAENVLTFTYGKPSSREARVSQKVAEACGFDWRFVEINDDTMSASWANPATEEFLSATWSGNALPHIQDWYALQYLTQSGEVSEESIVLPGHTVVGNEHDGWIYEREGGLSRTELKGVLGHKHYLLQGKSHRHKHDKHFSSVIDHYLDEAGYRQGQSDLYEITSLINLLERQAKYINNSMRAYEFFGLQWALPMIEPQVARLWHKAPLQVRDVARSFYIEHINTYFARVTGVDLGFFSAPLGADDKPLLDVMRRLSDFLRIRGFINDLFRIRVELNHPMGFHNLVPSMSRGQLALKLFRGAHILGVYSELFLHNQWIPGQALVPRAVH